MSEDRKTLKRGLDALLGDEPISSQQAQSQEIAIDKISPSRYQARENINQESLEELTESISSQGVIQMHKEKRRATQVKKMKIKKKK
jgi:ParB family chromosome partitioning protein